MVADPSHEQTETQGEWPYALAFSGVILLLGLALPRFARLVGDRIAIRVSFVVAGGAVLGSVANVFEDGLKLEWVAVEVGGPLMLVTWVGAAVVSLALAGRHAVQPVLESG